MTCFQPLLEEHDMNTDPFLVGVNSVFPNQNSSTAPAAWDEDTDQGAQQGIPSASGPMLTLTKRSNNLPVLPNGAVNPAPEPDPVCMIVDNLRMNAGVAQRLSAAQLGSGLVGEESIGGTAGAPGVGVVGIGLPGDGVRGIAAGDRPIGHGVAGFTTSPSVSNAGVMGEARAGAVGVLGRCPAGSGIGVRGLGSSQAVRGDGGAFGVVGTGTTTGVDGTGPFGVVGRGTVTGVDGRATGAGTRGVIGIGGVAGVQGGNRAIVGSGIGVLGVPGPNFVSGGLIFTPWAGRFDGPVFVRTVGGAGGNLSVDGSLFVTGTKSALIPHADGSHRAMYAVEAPDSWFEDVGRAQLHQGVARVDIDSDFAAVSGLADDYHVFLTPEGPSNGLYVTGRSPGGFEVREQGEGNAEISFSYRIMTRRTDVRTKRLEPIELPTEDGLRGAEPADLRDVPSPATPAFPEEPEDTPTTKLLPEGAVPEPPSDWPETVPWPPDIMRSMDTR
jgi:hypothetical protein